MKQINNDRIDEFSARQWDNVTESQSDWRKKKEGTASTFGRM